MREDGAASSKQIRGGYESTGCMEQRPKRRNDDEVLRTSERISHISGTVRDAELPGGYRVHAGIHKIHSLEGTVYSVWQLPWRT